jgi:hypothetical protein
LKGGAVGLYDIVVLEYRFKSIRLLRRAVRWYARSKDIPESEVIVNALLNYEPIKDMIGRIERGEKYVVG